MLPLPTILADICTRSIEASDAVDVSAVADVAMPRRHSGTVSSDENQLTTSVPQSLRIRVAPSGISSRGRIPTEKPRRFSDGQLML